jgi:ABC-2 type transport system ATP-binding protein
MGAAVEIRGIRKSFYGQRVLEGVDLHLEAGKIYLLTGPNGAGKSTLMRVLMRQEIPDRGEGRILGFALDGDHPTQNLEIALVSESTDYALPLSMQDIFSRFPRIHPRWDAAVFKEMTETFGIDLSRRFSDLSRGQRMQVALAAAFASRPKLYLLDEVTSVLDDRARDIVLQRLKSEASRGATVVMSTHLGADKHELGAETLTLQGGRITRLDQEAAR